MWNLTKDQIPIIPLLPNVPHNCAHLGTQKKSPFISERGMEEELLDGRFDTPHANKA